jgi:hypothetical protein
MFKLFLAGFSINLFTSIDDALTRIPILSANTRSNKGRLAFSFGNLLAVTVAVAISYALSQFLTTLPGGNVMIATFIFFLAGILHFDLLAIRPPAKLQAKIEDTQVSPQRITKLIALGFAMTFITMIDDMFALAPLFTHSVKESLVAIIGIYTSSLLLIVGVIFFAEKLTAIPHKRSIATGTLILFGFLLLFGVI